MKIFTKLTDLWYMTTEFIGISPDSKVHGASMGPIWGQQDPDGPHVGPMNFALWVIYRYLHSSKAMQTHWNSLSFTVTN